MKATNKRRERTQALIQALIEATARRRMDEQADNAIEQHRFNKLIEEK